MHTSGTPSGVLMLGWGQLGGKDEAENSVDWSDNSRDEAV